MPISPFDDVADVALATDEALLGRVRDLVEGAYRQQLWFMFLDEDDRQLPLLVPLDVPDRPEHEHSDPLGPFLVALVDEVRPRSIVVVLERPGPDELTRGDREWFAVVDNACRAAGVVRRGPILAHDDGFRWIAAEDLLVGGK
jgi:hypothetical protein